MTRRRLFSALAVIAASTVFVGCAANEQGDAWSPLTGTLDATGSSAQAGAQDVWIAAFQRDNGRVTVNYEPAGSGAGREQFIAGGVSFAGSDSALNEEELAREFVRCAPGTPGIDLPVYLSPIVLAYDIDGVDDLGLDAATIAGIFSDEITHWDDPAIVALNPDTALPASRITAVHRSDDSGTTKNFTDYLHEVAPEAWPWEPSDTWPVSGGEAAQGTSGVYNAVTGGVDSIGYIDASRATDLTVAKLLVGDEFVEYSSEAAAAVVDVSPLESGRAENDIVIDIDRASSEPGVYPLVLVSYVVACSEYADADEGELARAYIEWVVSAEGQALAEKQAGSAPLSSDFAARVLETVATIR